VVKDNGTEIAPNIDVTILTYDSAYIPVDSTIVFSSDTSKTMCIHIYISVWNSITTNHYLLKIAPYYILHNTTSSSLINYKNVHIINKNKTHNWKIQYCI
jgi:hypothetical protein